VASGKQNNYSSIFINDFNNVFKFSIKKSCWRSGVYLKIGGAEKVLVKLPAKGEGQRAKGDCISNEGSGQFESGKKA